MPLFVCYQASKTCKMLTLVRTMGCLNFLHEKQQSYQVYTYNLPPTHSDVLFKNGWELILSFSAQIIPQHSMRGFKYSQLCNNGCKSPPYCKHLPSKQDFNREKWVAVIVMLTCSSCCSFESIFCNMSTLWLQTLLFSSCGENEKESWKAYGETVRALDYRWEAFKQTAYRKFVRKDEIWRGREEKEINNPGENLKEDEDGGWRRKAGLWKKCNRSNEWL